MVLKLFTTLMLLIDSKITIKHQTMGRLMPLELALLTCCGYAFLEKVLHLPGQPL